MQQTITEFGRLTWRTPAVALALCLVAAATLFWHDYLPILPEGHGKPLPFIYHWDSQAYMHMATGYASETVSPFSKRWLCPLLAKTLNRWLGGDIGVSFLALNVFAFILLAFCLAALLEMTVGLPQLAALFLLTPLPLESLQMAYIPDLFHMSVTACMFLMILRENYVWSLVLMLLAFAVRESTLLICLCCAVFGYFHKKRTLCYGSLIVLLLGVLLSNAFARVGKPNLHHLPESLYMALKVPYNFLRNYCGVAIWTEVIAQGDPGFRLGLPSWLQLGKDKTIGLSFDWWLPAATLIAMLSTFGIGPVLAAPFARKPKLLKGIPFVIQLSFVYGCACFLLGPSLGSWVERLVGYAWPAFWLALPWLFKSLKLTLSRGDCWFLGTVFVVVSWFPRAVGYVQGLSPSLSMLVCIPYVITISWFRRALARRREETLVPVAGPD